jgi:predicted nucleotidyltransferase
MNQSVLTHLRSQRVRDIFDRNHIERVYLVGSFARGEERDTSDIDLIFEKKPNTKFTLFNIGDMKYSLEEEL